MFDINDNKTRRRDDFFSSRNGTGGLNIGPFRTRERLCVVSTMRIIYYVQDEYFHHNNNNYYYYYFILSLGVDCTTRQSP